MDMEVRGEVVFCKLGGNSLLITGYDWEDKYSSHCYDQAMRLHQ